MPQTLSPAPPPAAELPFKYVGGDPAIDLVNTVDWTSRGPEHDRLASYERLVEWAQGAQIVSSRVAAELRSRARVHPKAAALAFRAAVRTRDVLWQLFGALARNESQNEPLRAFNGLLGKALTHLQVTPVREKQRTGSRLELGWDDLGESLESVLWPVLWSAASLLTSDECSQIRICGSLDCGWMFVDRSRNGLRRWCQMETCGTLEKTRRRYQRD